MCSLPPPRCAHWLRRWQVTEVSRWASFTLGMAGCPSLWRKSTRPPAWLILLLWGVQSFSWNPTLLPFPLSISFYRLTSTRSPLRFTWTDDWVPTGLISGGSNGDSVNCSGVDSHTVLHFAFYWRLPVVRVYLCQFGSSLILSCFVLQIVQTEFILWNISFSKIGIESILCRLSEWACFLSDRFSSGRWRLQSRYNSIQTFKYGEIKLIWASSVQFWYLALPI
jgi:hypothetical protein